MKFPKLVAVLQTGQFAPGKPTRVFTNSGSEQSEETLQNELMDWKGSFDRGRAEWA